MKRIICFLVVLCIAFFAFGCGKGEKNNTSETKEKGYSQEKIEKMVAEADQYWYEYRYKDAMEIYSELINNDILINSKPLGDFTSRTLEEEKNYIYFWYAQSCVFCGTIDRAVTKLRKELKDPDSLVVEKMQAYNVKDYDEIDPNKYSFKMEIIYRAKNSFGGYVRESIVYEMTLTESEKKALLTSAKRVEIDEKSAVWQNWRSDAASQQEEVDAVVNGTAIYDISLFR